MSFYNRKRLRLKGYDYSNPGCYFITILTHNRQKLFWTNGKINELGAIVEQHINDIPSHYNLIKVDNYIVMPDHIHLMITIGCDALPDNQDVLLDAVMGKLKYPDVKNVVGSLKSFTSREIHKIYPDLKVWHKSYYDHIITDKNDYDETWDYIDANPIRWEIKHGKIS